MLYSTFSTVRIVGSTRADWIALYKVEEYETTKGCKNTVKERTASDTEAKRFAYGIREMTVSEILWRRQSDNIKQIKTNDVGGRRGK